MNTSSRNVCLVTGAASGYGKEICLRFSELGANVIIVDMNTGAGVSLANKLNEMAKPNQSALFCNADVTSVEAMQAVFNTAKTEFGRIDVVVNNAGIAERVDFVDDMAQTWRQVIDIDLNAVILGTALAMQFNVPTVINMASAAGLIPMKMAPIYTAAKHGVVGFSTSLHHVYLSTNTRVNCIAPFFSDTPMYRGITNTALHSVPLVPVSLVVDAVMLAVDNKSLVCRVLVVKPDGVHVQPRVSAKL